MLKVGEWNANPRWCSWVLHSLRQGHSCPSHEGHVFSWSKIFWSVMTLRSLIAGDSTKVMLLNVNGKSSNNTI